MPMEPVYADQVVPGASGGAGATLAPSSGAVRLNVPKQQGIGVQVGEVARTAETSTIRTLGRIVPDENRVYPVIAATDGWLEPISEGTTGSQVSEHQLLAQIKVYNYDFYTWQQRYLTELGYTHRISVDASPLSTTNQSRRRAMSGAGYEAGLPIPESEARLIKRGAVIAQGRQAEQQGVAEQQAAAMPRGGSGAAPQAAGTPPHPGAAPAAPPPQSAAADHAGHHGGPPGESEATGPEGGQQTNLLYTSKGRLELLNLGVEESRIDALAESGAYITSVDLRSPVNGYVLSRTLSPRQRIDRGTECFRIADLSRVWVEADIYDIEAMAIQPGMEARVSLPRQGNPVTATVSEILPRFNAASRTLKVRLELDNPQYLFRPEMFVDVEFLVPLPESVSVPASAVIDSGRRKTVYVAVAKDLFEPRTVTTGWQSRERIEIVDGLEPGEKIVVSGNFLIDSESRMKLAAAGLMTEQPKPPPGPQDPSASQPVPSAPASPAPETATPGPAAAQPPAAEKVVDPVCSMTVDPVKAAAAGLTVELDGTLYAFCSAACKEQFEQDPQRYLGKGGQPPPPPPPGHQGHGHD